jgi:hypothetical protein
MSDRIQFNIDIIFKYLDTDMILNIKYLDSDIDLNLSDSVSNIRLHLDHVWSGFLNLRIRSVQLLCPGFPWSARALFANCGEIERGSLELDRPHTNPAIDEDFVSLFRLGPYVSDYLNNLGKFHLINSIEVVSIVVSPFRSRSQTQQWSMPAFTPHSVAVRR